MYSKKWQNTIIDQLAFKYGLDKRVVQEIVYYPLRFTRDVMNDPKDDTPVRIKRLGVFAYRGSRDKEKTIKPKYDQVLMYLEELYKLEYNTQFDTLDEFTEYVVDMFKSKEYGIIVDIHKTFKDKIKYKIDESV